MYLQEFRDLPEGKKPWHHSPEWEFWAGAPRPDLLLDEVDDTLNSWKEAYQVFNAHQAAFSEVKQQAFASMKPLVHKVIADRLQNTVNSWPVEALTYELLRRWIKVEQAERKLREPTP